MNPPKTKICTKCGKRKKAERDYYQIHKAEIKEKYRKKNAKQILAKQIRIAHREAIKEDKLRTREKARAFRQTDEWKEGAKAKQAAATKKWQENNKEKWAAYQKARNWRLNKEKILERAEQAAYREEHKRERKKKRIAQQVYYELHKEEIAEARRGRENAKQRHKYHNDPERREQQESSKRRCAKRMADSHIKRTLWRKFEFLANEVTPEMIKIQREYMIINRMISKKQKGIA